MTQKTAIVNAIERLKKFTSNANGESVQMIVSVLEQINNRQLNQEELIEAINNNQVDLTTLIEAINALAGSQIDQTALVNAINNNQVDLTALIEAINALAGSQIDQTALVNAINNNQVDLTTLIEVIGKIDLTIIADAIKTLAGRQINCSCSCGNNDYSSIVEAINALNLQNGGGNNNNNISVEHLIPITYSELVALRDNSQLQQGVFYRITDYEFTTTLAKTSSANHSFDIIVLAVSSSHLNENARAILHNDDTYFLNSNLDAWRLKYDLDNDTAKYEWVDGTNGKGVVYFLEDEFGNKCEYDFKNLLIESCYTFDLEENGHNDYSLNGVSVLCYDNRIGSYVKNGVYSLPFIFFQNKYTTDKCCGNVFENDCHSNHLERNCYNNTFKAGSNTIYTGSNCHDCYFGKNNSHLMFIQMEGAKQNIRVGNNCKNHNFLGSQYENTSIRVDDNLIGEFNLSSTIEFPDTNSSFSVKNDNNTPRIIIENAIFDTTSATQVISELSVGNKYIFGELQSLEIQSIESSSLETTIVFRSGETPTVLTLPQTLTGADEINILQNRTYRFVIVNNMIINS